MKQDLVKIIANRLRTDMDNLEDYRNYYVNNDVSINDIFLMVEDCVKIAIKETIEVTKCHSQDVSCVDWEGAEANSLNMLGVK